MKKFFKNLLFLLFLFLLNFNFSFAIVTEYNSVNSVSIVNEKASSPIMTAINIVGAITMIFTIINLIVGFTRWKFLASYNVDERKKAFNTLYKALFGLLILIIIFIIDYNIA